MKFSVDTLKLSAKIARDLCAANGIDVKAASARKMWAFTLIGHERFESLVEQARTNGELDLPPNAERMVQWGKSHRKDISLDAANKIISESVDAAFNV